MSCTGIIVLNVELQFSVLFSNEQYARQMGTVYEPINFWSSVENKYISKKNPSIESVMLLSAQQTNDRNVY